MSNIPRVTVIIAAYNCAPYLGAAIASALEQGEQELEILVVDDASTDQTSEVARSFEETGKVRLLVNDVNRGPSFSRNRAIQEARGEWVAQLDGDDWYAPGRLQALLQPTIACQADFIADDLFKVENRTLRAISTLFLDNGVPWRTIHSATPLDLIRYDLGSIKPVMRRSFLVEHSLIYEEGVKYGEDFLLLLKAMLAGARVTILPDPMYHLRRGETGSLTTQRSHLFSQIEFTTKQLMADQEVNRFPEVIGALRERLRRVGRWVMLEQAVSLAKEGRSLHALGALLSEPKLIFSALRRATEVMFLRMRRRNNRRVLNLAHLPPSFQKMK